MPWFRWRPAGALASSLRPRRVLRVRRAAASKHRARDDRHAALRSPQLLRLPAQHLTLSRLDGERGSALHERNGGLFAHWTRAREHLHRTVADPTSLDPQRPGHSARARHDGRAARGRRLRDDRHHSGRLLERVASGLRRLPTRDVPRGLGRHRERHRALGRTRRTGRRAATLPVATFLRRAHALSLPGYAVLPRADRSATRGAGANSSST